MNIPDCLLFARLMTFKKARKKPLRYLGRPGSPQLDLQKGQEEPPFIPGKASKNPLFPWEGQKELFLSLERSVSAHFYTQEGQEKKIYC